MHAGTVARVKSAARNARVSTMRGSALSPNAQAQWWSATTPASKRSVRAMTITGGRRIQAN